MKTMRFLATTIAAVMTAVMASTMMVNAFAAGPGMGTTGECNEYDTSGIDLENAAVKPTLSLSRIELPINEAQENNIVTIELTVSGANEQYASTGGDTGFTEEQLACADVNKDKKVDAKDATVALGYYGYTSTGGTATISEFIAQGL